MNVVVGVLITLIFCMCVGIMTYCLWGQSVSKAVRYAITLTNKEGAFVALCTEKHRDRWVFEDVRITPANPGGPVVHAAPGKLHVPKRNILYYQEITEVSDATQ